MITSCWVEQSAVAVSIPLWPIAESPPRSCTGPMTSSRRPARFSLRRSSTADSQLKAYIDQHSDTSGVESICKVLQIAPSCYRRRAAQIRHAALRCDRAKEDDELIPRVQRVWHVNMQVYGAGKVWRQLNREGTSVARCTGERLMR
jgi:hypothetical protein